MDRDDLIIFLYEKVYFEKITLEIEIDQDTRLSSNDRIALNDLYRELGNRLILMIGPSPLDNTGRNYIKVMNDFGFKQLYDESKQKKGK